MLVLMLIYILGDLGTLWNVLSQYCISNLTKFWSKAWTSEKFWLKFWASEKFWMFENLLKSELFWNFRPIDLMSDFFRYLELLRTSKLLMCDSLDRARQNKPVRCLAGRTRGLGYLPRAVQLSQRKVWFCWWRLSGLVSKYEKSKWSLNSKVISIPVMEVSQWMTNLFHIYQYSKSPQNFLYWVSLYKMFWDHSVIQKDVFKLLILYKV